MMESEFFLSIFYYDFGYLALAPLLVLPGFATSFTGVGAIVAGVSAYSIAHNAAHRKVTPSFYPKIRLCHEDKKSNPHKNCALTQLFVRPVQDARLAEDFLKSIKIFLDNHTDAIITINLQDETKGIRDGRGKVVELFKETGLDQYMMSKELMYYDEQTSSAYLHGGALWPTLHTMREAQSRLVVFSDETYSNPCFPSNDPRPGKNIITQRCILYKWDYMVATNGGEATAPCELREDREPKLNSSSFATANEDTAVIFQYRIKKKLKEIAQNLTGKNRDLNNRNRLCCANDT